MDNKGNKSNAPADTNRTTFTTTADGINNTVFDSIPLKPITESDHSQTQNQTTRQNLNE